MAQFFVDLMTTYGYFTIVLATAIDHTGTPAPLILATGLAASGVLDIKYVLFAALLGSYLGDCIGFIAGKYGGRPFAIKYGHYLWIDRGKLMVAERAMERYGTGILIWGRFLAIVSRMIPFAAGTLGVRPSRFFVLSIPGNLLMNFSYGLAGYFFSGQVNRYFDSPWLAIYVTAAVIILHLVVSLLWIRSKQTKSLVSLVEKGDN